ncbi:hypothetical protein N7530_001839 [Penicillium desertorum]|uniref:SnoaL-like domain-containing protein n=1 Tax=Penicillium desertorum TaxID=1303715 RepID=A0A9W9XAR2_9EURO|nr:hypothetical protein N7530_001839 [Penicillium desertorum]
MSILNKDTWCDSHLRHTKERHPYICNYKPEIYTDAGTIEAIRNTLAIYAFAVDGKDFDALSKVFTTGATANYSAPPQCVDPAENDSICAAHEPGMCNHATSLRYTTDRCAFPRHGQAAYAYGQYQDDWKRQSSGTWRIVHRNLVYMGPQTGNMSVFLC